MCRRRSLWKPGRLMVVQCTILLLSSESRVWVVYDALAPSLHLWQYGLVWTASPCLACPLPVRATRSTPWRILCPGPAPPRREPTRGALLFGAREYICGVRIPASTSPLRDLPYHLTSVLRRSPTSNLLCSAMRGYASTAASTLAVAWLVVMLATGPPGANALPTPPGASACTVAFNETVETIYNPTPSGGEAFSNQQMAMIGRILGVPDSEGTDVPREVYFYLRDLATDEYGPSPTQTLSLPGFSASISVAFEGRFGSVITQDFLQVIEYTGVPATPYSIIQTTFIPPGGAQPSKMMCNKIIFATATAPFDTLVYQKYPGAAAWVPHAIQPTLARTSAMAVYFPQSPAVGAVELPELIVSFTGTSSFSVLIPDQCCCDPFVTVQTVLTPSGPADLGVSIDGHVAVGMPGIGTVLIHTRGAVGPYSAVASQMFTGPSGFGFCVTFTHDDDTLVIGSPFEVVAGQPGLSGRVYTYKASGGGTYTLYAVYDNDFGNPSNPEGFGYNCASDYSRVVIGDYSAVANPGFLASGFGGIQTGRLGVFYTSDVGGEHHCDLDGDFCTGDVLDCPGGACIAGPALSYDDNNACTADSCHPVLGFLNEFEPLEGLSCPDPLGDPLCSGTCSCGACINVICVSPSPSASPTPMK